MVQEMQSDVFRNVVYLSRVGEPNPLAMTFCRVCGLIGQAIRVAD